MFGLGKNRHAPEEGNTGTGKTNSRKQREEARKKARAREEELMDELLDMDEEEGLI